MISRTSTSASTLAVLVIVLVTLGVYAGAYFWLGEYTWFQSPGRALIVERDYRDRWQVGFFFPAAKVEGLVRGINVRLRYRGDGGFGVI